MILVDTSVWIDHLRKLEPVLSDLLHGELVLMHPFVIGELAVGIVEDRRATLKLLSELPSVTTADHTEVLSFIDEHHLYGSGIGFVDAHLLTSVALDAGTRLWTRDRRLVAAAGRRSLGVPLFAGA